ncbi:bifunctional nicotinamidase/pyrazinamidase [Roseomonas indoligenes]|uniref:Nicotinamidase n=1 Tax=Roseomonas indoligenes TaxID=2820811 RepID=A0A940N0T3_9PROT|nr:bifunctional nicotinamidase/pyrazinamidase [Pararoseomonas indoligenes]MBP0493175.1 bifunctional nicotinamidase/pyrazinamidase [Pararoseomonas indoligenes]
MALRRRSLFAALAGLPLLTTKGHAITPGADSALIVVDVQNCFTPGGSLAVKDGDAVVPVINALSRHFANVVLTQDWHTPDHVSFASQHQGQQPFGTVSLPYGTQVLWPDHCVMGTEGAALHPALSIPHAQLVIRKGYHRGVDSYSAFLEADRTTRTGLDGYLNSRGIRKLYVAGLATDFCVAWTALDARRLGFEATVIEDACRAIDLNGSLDKAWAEMAAAGVGRIRSQSIG